MPRVNLKNFKRAKSSSTTEAITNSAEPARTTDWIEFDRDVRATIAAMREAALATITNENDYTQTARITVSAVMNKAGRSRAALYAEHPELLTEIRSAQEAVNLAARQAPRPKTTKEDLRKQVSEANAQHRLELAKVTSQSLTDLIEFMGPSSRDRARLMQEMNILKSRVQELENINSNQANLIRNLTSKLNSTTKT